MSVFSEKTPPQSPLSPNSAHKGKKLKAIGGASPLHLETMMKSGDGKPSYVFDELKEVCTLGTGSFGTVKLVHHESSGHAMALKILKKDTIVEFRQEKNILSEKDLLLECTRCPFIINLISTFNFPNKLCMLLELVQGGELLTHLYDRSDTIPKSSFGGFSIDCNIFYTANILLAFEFMHSKGISYRDLKPENILVNNDGYIKLADFGFAKVLPYTTPDNQLITKTYTIVGSPEYMAPEMLNNLGYDNGVDYWSLGCLIYELVFANSLFADRSGYPLLTQENIRKCSKESISDSFPEQFRDDHSALYQLALSFLAPDPAERAGFKDMTTIRSSAIFTSDYWSQVEARQIKPFYVPSLEHHLDTSNFFDFDEEEEEQDVHFEGDQSVFDLF